MDHAQALEKLQSTKDKYRQDRETLGEDQANILVLKAMRELATNPNLPLSIIKFLLTGEQRTSLVFENSAWDLYCMVDPALALIKEKYDTIKAITDKHIPNKEERFGNYSFLIAASVPTWKQPCIM